MTRDPQRRLLLDLAERMVIHNRQALIDLESKPPRWWWSASATDHYDEYLTACRRDQNVLERLIMDVRKLDEDIIT